MRCLVNWIPLNTHVCFEQNPYIIKYINKQISKYDYLKNKIKNKNNK